MKAIEIAARLFGRQFKIIKLTIKEIPMAKEATVRIKIVDSHGIGYANGHEYDVTPEEAKKLIGAKKAIPLTGPAKVETATAKTPNLEKRKTGK